MRTEVESLEFNLEHGCAGIDCVGCYYNNPNEKEDALFWNKCKLYLNWRGEIEEIRKYEPVALPKLPSYYKGKKLWTTLRQLSARRLREITLNAIKDI